MIQSAMMFALGFFVSGLLWVAFSVALVRRTRGMTERRILARVATRRAEFEAERDELRARHAVQMHRLEREVSRVLDLATAHRLEADIKERDLGSVKAELTARLEDLQDLEQALEEHRDLVQDLERRHAEATSALRATQHTLGLETKRRLQPDAGAAGIRHGGGHDERFMPSHVDAYQAAARFEREDAGTIRVGRPSEALAVDAAEPPHGSSVVPLPTRLRASPSEAANPAAEPEGEPGRNLRRIAGEAHGDFETNVWRAPAVGEPRLPLATSPDGKAGLATPDRESENRIHEAVDEMRSLKRAASQAGE